MYAVLSAAQPRTELGTRLWMVVAAHGNGYAPTMMMMMMMNIIKDETLRQIPKFLIHGFNRVNPPPPKKIYQNSIQF